MTALYPNDPFFRADAFGMGRYSLWSHQHGPYPWTALSAVSTLSEGIAADLATIDDLPTFEARQLQNDVFDHVPIAERLGTMELHLFGRSVAIAAIGIVQFMRHARGIFEHLVGGLAGHLRYSRGPLGRGCLGRNVVSLDGVSRGFVKICQTGAGQALVAGSRHVTPQARQGHTQASWAAAVPCLRRGAPRDVD